MKATKITYWLTTVLFALMMMSSALGYFISDAMKETFTQLGFPSFFRVELGIAKILGGAVLLLPFVKGKIKEWAYAGFTITVVSAFIAHLSVGDPAAKWSAPLIALVLLAASYFTYTKLHENPETA